MKTKTAGNNAPKNSRARLYWIGITGLLLVISVIVVRSLKGNKLPEVYTEEAAARDLTELVSASGKIQPETEVKISSDVSGEITEMLVKEGDQVKKGDLLCRIRPDLYMSAFDRVNASVNTTRANLKSAQAQLEQARANLINSESAYNRNKKLLEQHVISQQEFEAIRAQYESARANVSALEAGVNASLYTIQSSEASLKEANANLEKTFIYSPVDATVSRLSVEKGERVVGVSGMSGTEIMRLANLHEMEVSVEVNENDIIKVHYHDTAIIEVDAYMDKKFRGIVTSIANSSSATGISVDQVTNFVVKIRILRESYSDLITPRNPIPFRPGMSASVDIQTRRVRNAVTVPIQAVTTREKDTLSAKKAHDGISVEHEQADENGLREPGRAKEYVFVLEGDKVLQTEVKTGIQDNHAIEIISGLSTGQAVVCGPYSAVSKSLKHQTRVKVVRKEELYKTGD
jgi:HlyD family secretion protein